MAHVLPLLHFMFQPHQQHSWIQHRWTNNACESANNLLSRLRHLPELLDKLYSVVQMQMKDLQRALYSHRNYILAAAFTMLHAVWQLKCKEENEYIP